MDKVRSSKHLKKRPKKSGKKSKRRHHSRDSPSEIRVLSSHRSGDYQSYNKLVGYSDVSSEDFSAPEAGEIEDEESFSLSDKESSMLSAPSASMMSLHENNRSTTPRMNFQMSPQQIRKVILGSPISSSLSSATSRSKMQQSLSPLPQKHSSRKKSDTKKGSSTNTSIIDENEVDELDEIEDEEEEEDLDEDEEEMRRRRKLKKSKKKKSKKKKKKRRKSISSVESISDNESMLEDTVGIESPPNTIHQISSPYEKDNTYTPIKPSPMSPATPPLRPDSNASIYSDTSRQTPTRSNSKCMYIASPHTPPIVPNKKSSYHSPLHADMSHSMSHHHGSSHHYHHSHQYHQPRSPIEQVPQSSSRRVSKSPGKFIL